MAPRFRVTDRKQPMLFPPSLDDVIPEDHLARIVVDAVEQLDLSALTDHYNQEGDGRTAYDPAAMLATLIYAYAHCQATRKLTPETTRILTPLFL